MFPSCSGAPALSLWHRTLVEVAGHPTSVYCEPDDAAWHDLLVQFHDAHESGTVYGFTVPSSPVVYIGPPACRTLRYALKDPQPAEGDMEPEEGLMTLLHEAEHQAGHVDEHETECAALAQLRHYLTSLYGIPATTTASKPVTRYRWVRVRGKRVRRRYTVYVKLTVPNPRLEAMVKRATAARRYC